MIMISYISGFQITNKDKCHFRRSKNEPAAKKIDNAIIKSSKIKQLKEAKAESSLTFHKYLDGIVRRNQ